MTAPRLTALAAAFLLVAAAVLTPAAAFAASGSFEMQWAPEAMLIGDVGATDKTVVRDTRTLRYVNGQWVGTIGYTDVLGMYDGNSISSQIAIIDLALTGAPIEGGAGASGPFVGVVTLYSHPAGSLPDAASAKQAVNPTGGKTVYDVRGNWTATVSGRSVVGQLRFVSAVPRAGATGAKQEVAWFNRAPGSGEDDSDNQQFTLQLAGPAPKPSGSGASGETSGTSGSGSGSSAGAQTFLGYVEAGAGGTLPKTPPYVEPTLAARAHALIDARPAGATPLPANSVAIDRDVSGEVLDAKNVAQSLVPSNPPAGAPLLNGTNGTPLEAFIYARADAGSLPSPSARQRSALGRFYAAAIVNKVRAQVESGVAGSGQLESDAAAVPASVDAVTASRLRALLAAVYAVGARSSFDRKTSFAGGNVLAPTAQAASAIRVLALDLSTSIAGPVLAAADDARAPQAAVYVPAFARARSLDASGRPGRAQLPNQVLAAVGADADSALTRSWVLPYAGVGGPTSHPGAQGASSAEMRGILAESWLGYRRAPDGSRFWLAEASAPQYALTDASLSGWGWQTNRAALVDATRAGRWLAVYPYTPAASGATRSPAPAAPGARP